LNCVEEDSKIAKQNEALFRLFHFDYDRLKLWIYRAKMKILFVKLGALGDVINTLPLAVLLKQRLGAEISWLVAPLSLPLLKQHPAIHKTILFDRKQWRTSGAECVRAMREEKFDMALDLQRTLKSALFTSLSGARRKIGFDYWRCKDGTWAFPFERLPKGDKSKHMLLQYEDFARHLGVEPPKQPTWRLKAKGDLPFDLPETYTVLNIGATKKPNLWPSAAFAETADGLYARGSKCVLTGGPEDKKRAEEILQLTQSEPLNLVGQTSIPELVLVLQGARAVVSCDTGPMHLAVALGTRTLALFGPANPQRTGPFRGEVLRDATQRMDAITAQRVLDKLTQR
jgi:lipopolysaccharide heptosyltransferase I